MRAIRSFAVMVFAVASTDPRAGETRRNPAPQNLAAGFWADDASPATFVRLDGRLLVGSPAAAYDGSKIGNAPNWTWTLAQGNFAYLERNAQLTTIAPYAEIGGFFATRTSDSAKLPSVNRSRCCSIGVALLANNDNSDTPQSAWPLYTTTIRVAGAGSTHNEVDVLNADSVVHHQTSYGPSVFGDDGMSYGFAIQAGGEGAPYNNLRQRPFESVSASTAGLFIGGNGTTWDKGIVFQNLSISPTTDGTTVAIELPQTHIIRWVYDNTGQTGAFIKGTVSQNHNQNGLNFSDYGALFSNVSGNIMAQVNVVANATNHPFLSPAVKNGNVVYGAAGVDKDINLALEPKGSGAVLASRPIAAPYYIAAGKGGVNLSCPNGVKVYEISGGIITRAACN